MNQRISEKKQTINFTIDKDVPEFIILDKQKLIQILINLVSNAHKFSDISGCIDVDFYVVKDKLQITVKDNGIGISEQDICRLFSAFEQIKSSLYKTGTGLGLAISSKLAGLLGGDISVKSTLGLGSVFTVNVSYKQFAEYEAEMEKDALLLQNKMILVVDDNADNRILISEMLFDWDMKPIVCASALEALRMILSNRYKFSLGLIDICMPGTTGTELAKQIKSERPFFPLIALSSLDTFITTQDFEQKLDKPIHKIQLFNAIHRILSKKQTPNSYIGDGYESSDSESSLSSWSSRSSSEFNKDVKILIAEDILYNRNMLENMMEMLKYKNVTSAENGKIAIDMIQEAIEQKDPYDVLLLDLRMPVMNGYEVISAMKSKGWKTPKIVVVSASVMEEDLNRCKKCGVKYFISKPIELSELKDVMLHVTEKT